MYLYKMKSVIRLLHQFNTWRVKNISENTFIIILSLLVGIVSGLAAVLLKNAIHFSIHILEKNILEEGEYYFIMFPVIGIGLTYLFVKYIVKDNISHGVTRVLYAISKKDALMKPHNTWTSMFASTLTIAFGGSVGAEAPVVLTGSAIGSNLGRMFNLSYRNIALMIGCGAAGAIAGIFKAPLTGLLFTLEVLMLDLTMASLIPLMVSAVTATVIAYFFMGDSVLLSFKLAEAFDVSNIWYYIILGVFTGFVSIYFTRMTNRMENFYSTIKTPIFKILIGAGILTALVFLFPIVWGEGYNSIVTILQGEGYSIFQHSMFESIDPNSYLFLGLLLVVMFVKVIAMASTNGAGGVGGIFAPTLLMGSFAGYFLVHTLNVLFGLGLPESNFALAGMTGTMAAVMHAPMTGIFLIAEVTGGYDLILPLILTSTIAYLTIMLFERHSIYTKRLAQKGELLTHNKDKNVLMMLNMRKLIETQFVVLNDKMSLGDFVQEVPKSKRNNFPVVDEENKLVGIVIMEDVRPFIFDREIYDTKFVNEFMRIPDVCVDTNDTMEEVMDKFKNSNAWNLPVTENGVYKGFMSKSKLFNEYREMLLHFTEK